MAAGRPSTLETMAPADDDPAAGTLPARGKPPAGPATGLERGASLGRYVILDQLGAGGMGVVFAAYDPELDRKLAIKLVRSAGDGSRADEEGRTRLLREAQAMAKLDHPNVVGVHDVGPYGDGIFVAMDFVEGDTFGDWLEAEPRTWRQIVSTMCEAGRGLLAAHEKGLLHRDFKPDNVMVGTDGRARVMDFGLARHAGSKRSSPLAVEELPNQDALSVELTHAGAVMGTPAYMAPEQFLGDETTPATDQFGFCVVLWEALYGARPFAGESVAAIAFAVTQGKLATPPRTREVPAWLRPLLARGLSAAADDRWPSLRELLDRLADDPTVRRRRWLAAGGVVLALGVGVGGLQLQRQRQLKACEETSRENENQWASTREAIRAAFVASDLPDAAATLERLGPRLDAWQAAWTSTRHEVCTAHEIDGRMDDRIARAATACLDERRFRYEALTQALASGEKAAIRGAVASAAELPTPTVCKDEAWLQGAPLALLDQLSREQLDELRSGLAGARAAEYRGAFDEGVRLASEVAQQAADLGAPALEAEARAKLGWLAWRTGDPQRAESELTAAWSTAWESGHDEVATRAAVRLTELVGHHLARHQEGLFLAEISGSMIRRAGRTDDLIAADLESQIGSIHALAGDFGLAEEHHLRSLSMRERLVGSEAPQVANAHTRLGVVALYRGQYDGAVEEFERALEIRQVALGPEHPGVGNALGNLGMALDARGDWDEAIPVYERALAIKEGTLGPDNPSTAGTVANLGVVHWARGKPALAKPLFERALTIWREKLGDEHSQVGTGLLNLGNVHRDLGASKAALANYEGALAIFEKTFGADHLNVAYALTGIGQAHVALERPELALPVLERAREIRERESGDPGDLATTRFALARALHALDRDPERVQQLVDAARPVLAEGGPNRKRELEDLDAFVAQIPRSEP